MIRIILRRILLLLITMILVSMLTFIAFDLVSGDPARGMLGTEASKEQVEALRQEMGLDRPLPVRYVSWLTGFFSGDLGESYNYHQPVWSLISGKLEVSLYLCLISFIIIVLVSIPMGIASVRRTEGLTTWPYLISNQLCMAVPPFFTGILFCWVFGIVLKFFTPEDFPGFSVDFAESFRHLLFGAICLAIPRIAMSVRMLRSTIISEMNKAYVRTAISRGNDRPGVLRRHVLKNSLVSVITFFGQTLAELVGGAVVVEQVLGIPGLGRFLVLSISHRDYPVVQTIVVILAFWVVLAGMTADLINRFIDPRLRLESGKTGGGV